MDCDKNCDRAILSISETSLLNIIKDFLGALETINNNPPILQQFYDYLKIKFNIPCEIGMLFIEKVTMKTVFDNFKLKTDSMNSLTNEKINLYQWIAPRHLEINDIDITEILKTIRKIILTDVPSVKTYYLMSAIKILYEDVGKDLGLDAFFPYLVYCLIKANIKDIYAHIHYMAVFRRKYENKCSSECKHGFQIVVTCNCLISNDWNNEEEYYLTTTKAVIDYIAKLEFYDLKIDHDEFDKEILKRMNNKQNLDKPDESSTVF